MVEGDSQDVNQLCRICSTELKGKGVGIFSPECMDNLVGEKIRRYLYFSVSIKDSLPKMVCRNCLKKLENIHRFAKMAAEMQEKFRVLLSSKGEKPRIKIKTLDDINRQVIQNEVKMNEETIRPELENVEVNLSINDLQVVTQDVSINETITKTNKIVNETVEVSKKGQAKDVVKERKKKLEKSEKCTKVEAKIKIEKNEEAERKEPNREVSRNFALVNGNIKVEKKGNSASGNTEEEADTSDSDKLVIQDDEKSNPSLLHCLLVKGKQQQMSMDMDHDYLEKANNNETSIKKEPVDPEDEDIADEIVEDRLNQIIKDEMESESEHESELDKESDIEVTEMEVKVDPTLYFSNASQSGNEIEHDSQDEQDLLTIAEVTCSDNNSILHNDTITTVSVSEVEGTQQNIKASLEITPPIMTRHQQKTNPVIASLKMGKPYKCTLCPRSFITDIGLQNHLWSHLPKSRKASKDGIFIPKKVDLEESQVYSSNGVLHTAAPSENPLLLKYICPICGKKISTKGNLKVHLETHRPKGKYGCDICGRVFKTATNLFRHKDYHGGVQYPCPVCGRVYPTNSTLRAHSITHSDLRPHKCPLCSKTFKRNQDLKFHINQHTGARPYQCPYCPKAFASSGNCFSHRKRMHPLEVERDKERAAEIMG